MVNPSMKTSKMLTKIFRALSQGLTAVMDSLEKSDFERERARREAVLSEATDLVHLEYLERQLDRPQPHIFGRQFGAFAN